VRGGAPPPLMGLGEPSPLFLAIATRHRNFATQERLAGMDTPQIGRRRIHHVSDANNSA